MSNKQTTAMQELIEYCLQNTKKELLANSVGNRDVIPIETFYAKATELLTKERELIEKAFNTGRGNVFGKTCFLIKEGSRYFTQTFKQD